MWTSLLGLAFAAPNLPFQGELYAADGVPFSGDTAVVFRLHTQATGGDPVHIESATLRVHGGRFATALGVATPFSASLFRVHRDLWLSVELNGVSSDRVPLGDAPFAAFADAAGDAAQLAGAPATAVRRHTEPPGWADLDTSTFPPGLSVTGNLTLTGATLADPPPLAGAGLVADDVARTLSRLPWAAGSGLTLTATTFAAAPYAAAAPLTLSGGAFSTPTLPSGATLAGSLAPALTTSPSATTVAGVLTAGGGRLVIGGAAPACAAGNLGATWMDGATATTWSCDGVAWHPTTRGPAPTCASDGRSAATAGASCLALLACGVRSSGPRWIDPDGAGAIAAFQAFCDMTTDGGPSWA